MKYKLITFSVVVFVFLLSAVSMGAATSASTTDYTVSTTNQCTAPGSTVFITGKAPDQYNITTLNVPVKSCVKITFHNADTIDHTFSIDANAANNVTYFNIYLSGGQTKSLNFWTGSANEALKYYCAVPGHEANGMYGTMNVGSSSSSSGGSTPGFTLFSAVLALGMVVSYIRYSKKKRQE